MKKIGLTGVIGAGKSSVTKILAEMNIPILDCDKINADLLLKDNLGYQALCAIYHDDILDEDKNISKLKMADLMFQNPINKRKIEAILHPLIKQEIQRQFMELKEYKLVVCEVPLLYEVNWVDEFDEIWVVAADLEVRLHRLQTFRNVSKDEALRRLNNQISQEEKIKRANRVIFNNHDLTALKQQVIDCIEGCDRDES